MDWDGLVATVAARTNWPWAVVEDLTLPQLDALIRAWRRQAGLAETDDDRVIDATTQAGWDEMVALVKGRP